MRGIVLATALVASLGSTMTYAEPNLGSANYMLPLCKTWLKIAVEQDRDEIVKVIKNDPARLTSSGMCAGVVVGIYETLRTFELSCPPAGVTNDQLVRMVIAQAEKRPEYLHEDFVVPVSATIVGAWPCRPKK